MGKKTHNKEGSKNPSSHPQPQPQTHQHRQQQVKVTQKTPTATPLAPSGLVGNPKLFKTALTSTYPLTQKPIPKVAKMEQNAQETAPLAIPGTSSNATFATPYPKGGGGEGPEILLVIPKVQKETMLFPLLNVLTPKLPRGLTTQLLTISGLKTNFVFSKTRSTMSPFLSKILST